MVPKELLRKIRRIEIRTTHLVDDMLAGQYHSAFKGVGMEFEEVRPYQIGDDVRSIDWNVSARYGEPFIKIFREERERTVILLVDMSRSLLFGTQGQLKRELAAEVGATLAFSAIRNNDRVGLIGFTDRVEKFVPPRKGSGHVLRVIRELLAFEPTGRRTNLSAGLDYLNRVVRRRAVVFLMSDFEDRAFERPLTVARRRHDLIAVQIEDERERRLPSAGLMRWIDAETGRRMVVDTGSRRFRRRFAALADERRERLDHWLRQMKIDTIRIRTGEPYAEPLIRFFRTREARR